jgi:hypothetical protein
VRRLLLASIPLLLLAGCAASDPPARRAAPTQPRYQATGMVLQHKDQGPQLCLGAIATSYPPQCEGLAIRNWRWDQVEGEESAGGATWGSYQVVGTYDGTSFTVASAALVPPEGRPSHQEQFEDEPKPGCPEPAGGWETPDPARRSERHLEAVRQLARAQPDFAGLWLSYLEPMGNNVAEDPGEFVLNVAFTGELARHQAELRPRWGGRLCVTRQQRSYRRLQEIQGELEGAVGSDLGLRVLSTGLREDANAVSLMVEVLENQAREAIDARYGADAVEATAALVPVP